MELSNEQRELLSAYLDGEVSATERALAQALLERAEGSAYLASLSKMRELAQTHGQARAPGGFSELVRQALDGDYDSISRPTSNERATLHQIPAATWRMPLMAAAAALVIALGLFVYNAAVAPPPVTEVARETASAPARTQAGQPVTVAGKETAPPEASPKKPESLARDSLKEEKAGGGSDAKKVNEKAAEESTNDDPEDSTRGVQHEEPGKKSKYKESDRPDADKNSAKDSPKEGAVKQPGTRDDWREEEQKDAGPAREPAPKPAPQPPADPARADRQGAGDANEVAVEVSTGREADSATLVTDVLSVAALYGDAKVKDGEQGDHVEVEVSEDQLAEMLAALDKLATEQKRGNVRAGTDNHETAKRGAESGKGGDPVLRRAMDEVRKDAQERTKYARGRASSRGYLPKDARGVVENSERKATATGRAGASGDDGGSGGSPGSKAQEKEPGPTKSEGNPADSANKPAEGERAKSDSPAQNAAGKRKVKVVIRLK